VANLALRDERAPNVAGARLLGYVERQDAGQAFAGAAVGLVLDDPLEGLPPEQLGGAAQLIYLGTTLPDAARGARVVLPVANVAEEDGTFVNRDRRVQRYFQAKTAPGMARPAWWVLGELLAQLQLGGPFDAADEAFAWLAAEDGRFAGLSYDALGTRGVVLPEQRPAKVGA
jgi:predicted molibdopterin-dependent oxidoreductase YjgC